MKIAIFSDNFHPEIGGIQDSIELLAKELSRRGHKIHFYAPHYSLKDYQIAHLPMEEIELPLNVSITRFFSFPVPSPSLQSRFVVPTPFRWLKVKKDKPDIIHTQTFYGVGLEALTASKILRIPLIGTNHMAVGAFTHYVSGKTMDWFLKYAICYYNRCDYVTAPSKSVFEEMITHGLYRKNRVISNPIDTEIFCPAPIQAKKILKKKFGLSENTITFAGRLGVEKRIDTIIKAVPIVKNKFPDIVFAVAGHGSAENDLRQLTKTLEIENNVKFLGMLDEQDLANLYQASEIFVIMSTSETQSMSLLQAMACGLPVIGANSRALPEYIGSGNGFLVEPEDYSGLAKKIIYLLRKPKLRKKFGENGRNFAAQFSAPAIAQAWEVIYKRVIESYNR